MKLTWVVSTSLKRGYRYIKTRMTSSIVETSSQANPFGFDSNPSKNFIAIISETQSNDKPVVVGYLNPRALESLKVGDSMQYATDTNGDIQSTITLRNDGTAELLSNADNAVRYSKLEEAFNELNDKFNTFANAYVPGGPVSIGLPPAVIPSDADITKSKIEEIKVP